MTAYKIVTSKVSNRVLRSGCCDFLNDGTFDSDNEEIHEVTTGMDSISDINLDYYFLGGEAFTNDHATAEALLELKQKQADKLAKQAELFISREGGYVSRRQRTLMKLQSDADRAGRQDIYDYIQTGWDWAFLVMNEYFTKEYIIFNVASDEAAVLAVELDLDQFLPHARVQIKVAKGMFSS